MNSFISQTFAVINMNFRSLPRRIWMSLAMILASAVVVAILLAFLAMAKGFEVTLKGAGADDVAIFLREGSAFELNSVISRDQLALIKTAPGIVKDTAGPVLSAELYVIVDGLKKTTHTEANIPLRGIDLRGVEMRDGFKLSEGRMFTPGTNEMIVGQGIINEFDGFDLGSEVRFGKYHWRIVGVFTTSGNVFESELWADAKVIQNLYKRSNVQTIHAKLDSEQSLEQLRQFISNDVRLNIDVQTETEYFAEQSKGLNYMAIFGKVISTIMALGALAGALNTMYTSVADRAKEIATLRTIGFSNSATFVGTVVEALVLSAIGGILGSLMAYLIFDGMNTSTLGGSFTQVVFSFRFTGELFIQGILMALGIGLISGVFPAWRAVRMPLLVAFSSQH